MYTVGRLVNKILPFDSNKSNATFAEMLMAPSFGIEMCLFTAADVNYFFGAVRAMFIINGKEAYITVPIPKLVVYDDTVKTVPDDLKSAAFCFSNHGALNKIDTYDRLKNGKKYLDMLIPQEIIKNAGDILICLKKFDNNAVVKPFHAADGKGVINIKANGTKANGTNFTVIDDTNTHKKMTKKQLEQYIEDYIKEKKSSKYICQPFFRSVTKDGEPCDCRIRVCREDDQNFGVSIFARVGAAKGIRSNIHCGGRCEKVWPFLQKNFGAKAAEIHSALWNFGRRFPAYLQMFWKTPIFELGLDVGIKEDGKLFLYEASSIPPFDNSIAVDNVYVGLDIVISRLRYYKYIYENLLPQQADDGLPFAENTSVW